MTGPGLLGRSKAGVEARCGWGRRIRDVKAAAAFVDFPALRSETGGTRELILSHPCATKPRMGGAPVIFQEVVHSIWTGEAVCGEQADSDLQVCVAGPGANDTAILTSPHPSTCLRKGNLAVFYCKRPGLAV